MSSRKGDAKQQIRQTLLRRQRDLCNECGRRIHAYKDVSKRTQADFATLDHIIPLGRDGSNTIANLQLLCRPCNRMKGRKYIPLE